MPNHITNFVRLTPGDKARTHVLNTSGDKPRVDFNLVIPEPPEITHTSSPVEVVETQEEADAANKQYREVWGRFQDVTETVAAITQAEHDRRLATYGADNWYDWRYANWGVKWNAYDTVVHVDTDKELCIQFDTPWGSPTPMFEAWERIGLKVAAVSFDEDRGQEPYYYGDVEAVENSWILLRRSEVLAEREERQREWEEEEAASVE